MCMMYICRDICHGIHGKSQLMEDSRDHTQVGRLVLLPLPTKPCSVQVSNSMVVHVFNPAVR